MSKYKIISPIVIIAVLFSAVSITTAWTGPTANPTGNNVPAPINVGASTQTKGGLLNASGLNATSIFSYKGYLGGATNPPALNKILVSLDSNGIASWKSLQQIVQEVCSAPGSCPFLGGDSYWAVENDSILGKVIANRFPADINSLKITGPIRILNKTDFITEVNALNGVEFGFQDTSYIPGKVSHVDVRSNLGIYGPDTSPSSNLNKRLVKIFDDLRVENNLSVVANIAAGDKVTAQQFCIKSTTGGADVCSNTFGGVSNVLNGVTDGQTIRWSTLTNKWEPNSLFTINLNQKATEINNGSLVLKNSTGQVVGSVKSENDELAITGSPVGTFNIVRIKNTLATDFAAVKSLLISNGAGVGKVLVSDQQGNASWQATTSLGIAADSNWIKNGTSISNSNSGNVGIGTGSTNLDSSASKLTIKGANNKNTLNLTGGLGAISDSAGLIVNGRGAFYYDGVTQNVVVSDNEATKDLVFRSGLAERLRIKSNGKIGMGTNDPQNDLEVVNNQSGTTGVNVLNNNSGSAAIAQVGASNNAGYGSALRIITTGPNVSAGVLTGGTSGEADPAFTPDTAILRSGGALSGGLIISSSNGAKEGSISRGTKAGSIQFHTRSDDGTVYQSGFSKEGSLGIGTTNAASKLHVVGSILATPKSDGTGGILSGKNLILTGGAGDGKVLVSDANGLASWADSVSVGKTYGAGLNRGLELVGADNNLFAIKEGGVDTTEIKDGSILSLDLAGNSVDGSKIIDSSITAVDLAAGSVGNEEIAANAIGTGKIMAGGVMTDDIADANVTAAKLASMGATNGQFLQWNGSTWTPTSLPSATAYTASPTGGLSLTNNAFAIKAKGVLASMLDQMGATTGQVLSWNGTTWAPTSLNVTANSILPTATANQTIRFNGTTWVTNGNGLLTNGVKVSIGTGNLASTKNLHVAGGIATDDLVVTGNYVQSSKGKVLTDPAGNGEVFWESPVTTARFSKGSGSTFTRVAGSEGVSWSVQESNALGARDFVTMTCPAEREAIGGGVVCEPGNDVTASGPGASVRDWRVSCGDQLAFIQTITVTCARAN